jgi:hypothetical protein
VVEVDRPVVYHVRAPWCRCRCCGVAANESTTGDELEADPTGSVSDPSPAGGFTAGGCAVDGNGVAVVGVVGVVVGSVGVVAVGPVVVGVVGSVVVGAAVVVVGAGAVVAVGVDDVGVGEGGSTVGSVWVC